MVKILVAVDGSEYSKKALLKAKEFAAALNGEITIINVMNVVPPYDYQHNAHKFLELEKLASENSHALLEKAKMHFVDSPINVELIHKRGDPANEIINFADEGNFDLIVMGSRGFGVFKRTLLGSVSDKVVHHTDASVLIVK
mgnify:CR=1 FL=1